MKTNRIRRALTTLGGAAALAAAGLPSGARAQTFPSRALRFVVPFPAGSATDTVARIVAQAMGDALGQPVAVDNKPGANGILGAEQVKAAPADGYTMLVTTNTTQAANVSLYKKLSYDPVKDFTPIGKIGLTGFVLMVRPDFPAATLKDFLAHAKANPGKLSFGHGSAGSLVSGALLNKMGGVTATAVAYKGIPAALTDLIGGSLQYAFADVGNAVAQMKGGKLRGLAVTTPRRASRAPEVPTVAEAGLPGYEVVAWFGLMAPANLPGDVHRKLSDTLMAVLAKPDIRERIAAAGVDPDPQDAAALARTIDAEIRRWAGWVKDAGIQPE
ncbi:MAG TPA: tripartite tricarboxylate transporter substrate binding protein [Burkholderiaceae bacterium]|nr:tripartite tricarboxylate transporter substrate binding protein [Burkholderiaceae bacterium]